MSPEIITNYIERKAIESSFIQHVPDSEHDRSFFVIDDPYDLSEFDKALRSLSKSPSMLFELMDGSIDDQNNASYLNTVNCSFMILDRVGEDELIRNCRDRCYRIGKDLIKQILKDVRDMDIISDKMISCPLNSNYIPVGAIDNQYYGYQFTLQFVGPDGFC